MNETKLHTLSRSGDSPLKFRGKLIASSGGQQFAGVSRNRWHELSVYSADTGEYVVRIEYHSQWQGESGLAAAHVCGSVADVKRVLRAHEPIYGHVGYPDRDSDRQRRLESLIRLQWDEAVSELLGRDEFADSISDVEDEYAGVDAKAVGAFVRAVLADFPLTRAEACAICDANNGAMLFPPDCCWHGLAENMHDTPASALAAKWGCDASALAARVAASDRATRFALAWAIAQFWRRDGADTDEALKASGFFLLDELDEYES